MWLEMDLRGVPRGVNGAWAGAGGAVATGGGGGGAMMAAVGGGAGADVGGAEMEGPVRRWCSERMSLERTCA